MAASPEPSENNVIMRRARLFHRVRRHGQGGIRRPARRGHRVLPSLQATVGGLSHAEVPAIAVVRGAAGGRAAAKVYASYNGCTDLAGWVVLGGPSPGKLTGLDTPGAWVSRQLSTCRRPPHTWPWRRSAAPAACWLVRGHSRPAERRPMSADKLNRGDHGHACAGPPSGQRPGLSSSHAGLNEAFTPLRACPHSGGAR